MIKLDPERLENIAGKGENSVNKHFLLLPNCFQKPFHSGLLKLTNVCRKVEHLLFTAHELNVKLYIT